MSANDDDGGGNDAANVATAFADAVSSNERERGRCLRT